MSHGDEVARAPDGFITTGRTAGAPVAAFEDVDRRLAGVQFHPRCCTPSTARCCWNGSCSISPSSSSSGPTANIIDDQVASDPLRCRRQAGHLRTVRRGRLRGGRSPRAAGRREPAHLRLRRPRAAARRRSRAGRAGLRRALPGCGSSAVDARAQFLDALAGVTDPEEKRKIIGREFIRAFEAARAGRGRRRSPRRAGRVPRPGHALPGRGRVRRRQRHGQHQEPPQRRRPARRPAVLAGRAAAHAVQGRGARASASSSACPTDMVWRQPFPGPGPGHPHRRRRSPPSGSTSCARADAIARAGAHRRRPGPRRSGSARSCCWPTSARSASRATAAPTATRSCCARSPARTR